MRCADTSINFKGDNIKQYPRYLIASDARCNTEIKKHIAIAKGKFNK